VPSYPFHDKIIVVTNCGRICLGRKKINFSTVFTGQAVGINEGRRIGFSLAKPCKAWLNWRKPVR
jgi:hypothetical protein